MTKNLTSVNRRQAIAGAGAVAGALALTGPALADVPKPDRLAMLIERYYAEIHAYNTATDHLTDEECDALAEETYDRTLRELTGVPATTAAGAFAALNVIEREGLPDYYGGELDDARVSLLTAVRGYLEHGGKS